MSFAIAILSDGLVGILADLTVKATVLQDRGRSEAFRVVSQRKLGF